MITPSTWRPEGSVGLLWIPATIFVAAFLIGRGDPPDRSELWLWSAIAFVAAAAVTGVVLRMMHRRGKLISPPPAFDAPPKQPARPLSLAVFAGAALFVFVLPVTPQTIAWGIFSGSISAIVIVTNVLGYRDWRARQTTS